MGADYTLADIFTKMMKSTPIFSKLLEQQLYCLIGTDEEQIAEERRANLRKGQRDRRKERIKTVKETVKRRGQTGAPDGAATADGKAVEPAGRHRER